MPRKGSRKPTDAATLKRAASASLDDPQLAVNIRRGLSAADAKEFDRLRSVLSREAASGAELLTASAGLRQRADAIRQFWDFTDRRFANLDESRRAELVSSALHKGFLEGYRHEAGGSEFDGRGRFEGAPVWLDAKHRGGKSGRQELATKAPDKKLRQIERWESGGRGFVLNVVLHTAAGRPENRGLYYVPGFGAAASVSYNRAAGWDEPFDPADPLRPVRLLDGAELDRLLEGSMAMLKETEKRAKSYLSKADLEEIEESLEGQSSAVRKAVGLRALEGMSNEDLADIIAAAQAKLKGTK